MNNGKNRPVFGTRLLFLRGKNEESVSPGTPSSKAKKFFFSPKTGCSNRSKFVQTVAVFVMGYGCARRSTREWIRTVLFYVE